MKGETGTYFLPSHSSWRASSGCRTCARPSKSIVPGPLNHLSISPSESLSASSSCISPLTETKRTQQGGFRQTCQTAKNTVILSLLINAQIAMITTNALLLKLSFSTLLSLHLHYLHCSSLIISPCSAFCVTSWSWSQTIFCFQKHIWHYVRPS